MFSQCLRFYKWHLLISDIIQIFSHKDCKYVKIFSKATNFYNIIIVIVIIIKTPYNNALYLIFLSHHICLHPKQNYFFYTCFSDSTLLNADFTLLLPIDTFIFIFSLTTIISSLYFDSYTWCTDFSVWFCPLGKLITVRPAAE